MINALPGFVINDINKPIYVYIVYFTLYILYCVCRCGFMYGELTDKETVARLEYTLENQQQDQFEILLYKKNSKSLEFIFIIFCDVIIITIFLFIIIIIMRQKNDYDKT